MKNGKFVYKNEESLKKMHEFYDRTLAALDVPYEESSIETSFGLTHSLLVGDPNKPRICSIHGGNGITTLNLKLFLPLLNDFCIIAPDVVGMPGKSDPYRNISSKKDEYGLWISEVLDFYHAEKMSFVVSSYSSAMFLSFAKKFPQRVDKAVLLVPSGFDHASYGSLMVKMIVPFIAYYFHPTEKSLSKIMDLMGGAGDPIWSEFMNLMMSDYKMELRSPKEYSKNEFDNPKFKLLIIASETDVFFPAGKVFKKAKDIFGENATFQTIESKHLPSEAVMKEVCEQIPTFING